MLLLLNILVDMIKFSGGSMRAFQFSSIRNGIVVCKKKRKHQQQSWRHSLEMCKRAAPFYHTFSHQRQQTRQKNQPWQLELHARRRRWRNFHICVCLLCMQYLCTNIHLYGIYNLHRWWHSKQASSIQIISISRSMQLDIDICSFVMKMRTYYEWIKKGSRNKMLQ